jgi:biotin transport system ATP-binding protein
MNDGNRAGADMMIRLENVGFNYADGSIGLQDVSFEIPAGELVVVAGPNGSGKTTLLKHLNGLLLPQRGRVEVDGVCTREDLQGVRRRVGMVFQHADAQIVGETVADDVAFGPENLRLSRPEIDARVVAALDAVGLAHKKHQRPHLLSGGEKRRLTIAGILAMRPRVIVFDEPFSSLDLFGVQQVLRQILALKETGHTLLVTTHDLDKIIAHTDRLLLLHEGRLVGEGQPNEILPVVENYGVREPDVSRLGMNVRSWLN